MAKHCEQMTEQCTTRNSPVFELCTTTLENKQIKVVIADNGLGIPGAVKSKIFDHLFTTKGVGKGTGLGLAIARQIIVEAYGGTIGVDSEAGHGSKFCIQLPL